MNAQMVESIEKGDPSENTLRLTTRWNEITEPGSFRFIQGQWRKYTQPRTLRAEQERIEVYPYESLRRFERCQE